MNTSDHALEPGQACLQKGKSPFARPRAYHAPATRKANGRPLRVVIVGDSPVLLRVLSTLLEAQNNTQLIGSATDGYGAVRRVLELRPDLVLMDLHLPGINGLEASREIKSQPQAPAVIMVTADDTPGCRAAALAAGTDGFVDKQHLFAQLPPAIRKLFPEEGENPESLSQESPA